ncbi:MULTISPECIES: acyltransferase [unclassified Bradyrhizobium]|uniref:acyltransferase family protein n=1 Tax=unclassified Bradyrhizobium TaxID=2631580 RepID=UPI0028E92120|nr:MULTISPECIES: acyltransferase [unclassified Bradyrhizobium]
MAASSQSRLDHLDSIRGIASVIVLIAHVWGMNADAFRSSHHQLGHATGSFSDFLLYCLSRLEEGGRSAVILFFVLSGFVLAHSLKSNPVPYGGYVVKRVFRIYPAFFVAILISFLFHSLIGIRHVSDSEWARTGVDTADTSLPMLLKTLLLWGTTATHGLDGVDWSLVHEMRVSLIFPLLLLIVARYRWLAVAGFLLLSVVCTEATFLHRGLVLTGFQESTLPKTLIDTSYFIVFFAAGACLALDREKVTELSTMLPGVVKAILVAGAAFTFLKTDANLHTAAGCVLDYLRGIGSLVVIGLSLGAGSFQRALQHRGPVWLGRISYSLYLVHLPIIYLADQFAFDWPMLVKGPLVIMLSIGAAFALAELVEFPSIKLGKRFAVRQQPHLAPVAPA